MKLSVNQHTPGLDSWLAQFGCSTMALLALVGKDFTVDEINSLYKKMVQDGDYLNPNTGTGMLLWNKACAFLNATFGTTLSFAGSQERSYTCKPNERSIDHYYVSLAWPDHFTLEHEYDPANSGNAWDHGILLNKRIIRVG